MSQDYRELVERLGGWRHATMRRDGSTLGTMEEAATAIKALMADCERTRDWVDEERGKIAELIEERDALRAQVEEMKDDVDKYDQLLYAVGNKYHGESRHETALRYIKDAETASLAAIEKETKG